MLAALAPRPTASSEAAAFDDRLGCLVLLARAHGLDLTVQQIVRDNLLAGEVTRDTDDLLRCARTAGLRATAVQVQWRDVQALRAALPAMLCMRDDTAAVIEAVTMQDGRVALVLREPARPEETVLLGPEGFAARATGEMVLVRPDHAERPADRPFGFRTIADVMLSDRRLVLDVGLSAAAMSLLALTPVVFWTMLGSHVLGSGAIDTFTFLCVAAALLILFEGLFGALRRHALVQLTARVDRHLSAYLFDRLLALPMDVYEATAVGVVTRTVGHMAKVRAFLAGQLFGTLLDGGVLLVFLPVMATVSPLLTLVVLVLVGLIVAVLLALLPHHRRRAEAVDAADSAAGAFLAQTIQGIRTIKSLALNARQRDRWDVLTADAARLRLAESAARNLIQSMIAPLERLTLSGTVAIGVYVALVDRSAVSVAALMTFIMLTQRVAAPLLQLSQLVQQFDEARLAVARVGDLLNQPAEEGHGGHGLRTPVVGAVAFEGVRFRYRGAATPALRDVSFAVPAGTTLGIMGRSGSGKTTVTRLLQRLHSDYAGTVRIDGTDVRAFAVDHLRAQLGVVLQENFLFAGTVGDNIAAAKPGATPAEIVRAARLAGAEEFIDKLPGGYETAIAEGSPNLSGGQRQRLAIARALITDPRVLILDEATSALDAESEAIVNANLARIALGRTTIVISHRLSSLVRCDAILVMDAGTVHDIGTHAELMARCTIYSGLWARQNAHAMPAAASLPLSQAPQWRLRGEHG